MWAELLLIFGSYLLGSFSLAYVLGRWKGIDLRQSGTGNVGGSNLSQLGFRREGIIGTIWDALKGIICVTIGRSLGFDFQLLALAGFAATIGHCWPIFLGFKGGRGNGTGLGVAVILIPKELFLSLISPLIGFLIEEIRPFSRGIPLKERFKFKWLKQSKGIPLGILGSFILLPILCWCFGKPIGVILVFAAIFFIIVIRRITPRLGEDLRFAPSKKSILINRFLYDRSQK
jgi:glycerol-3-phosphate acyltransferase PlsY